MQHEAEGNGNETLQNTLFQKLSFWNGKFGIHIPVWWQSVTRQGIQLRTNFSFRDWTFFSEIVGKKDSCLPSEARLDSPSDRRSRKKKSNQGNKSLSKIVFPCRVNTIVTNRDTFFCLNGVCPTISHIRGHPYMTFNFLAHFYQPLVLLFTIPLALEVEPMLAKFLNLK